MKRCLVFLLIICFSIIHSKAQFQYDSTLVYDIVHVGANRTLKNLDQILNWKNGKLKNIHILLDEGTYYSDKELILRGKNIILEGKGRVNIISTSFDENVIWIGSANNVLLKNVSLRHLNTGNAYKSCTGNVVVFDVASDITVEASDINGCGVIGLYDNGSNHRILIKDCFVHNNSIAAFASGSQGSEGFEEIPDHPVFIFSNNRIANNGPNRMLEEEVEFDSDNYKLLRKITLELPDIVYEEANIDIQKINLAWIYYSTFYIKTDNKNVPDPPQNNIRDYSFSFEPKSGGYYRCGIDTNNLLFKIEEMGSQLQLKIFTERKDTIIIVSVNYTGGFVTTETKYIGFFRYESFGFIDISEQIFSSFDFAKDNFSKPTIDSLTSHYGRYPHTPKSYVYTLTPSDTIYIQDDFYDFECCDKGNFFIDPNQLDGTDFWRAYVFKRFNLKPVGRIKKKRKTIAPMFY